MISLQFPSIGRLPMGPVRSAAKYDRYAGLDFRNGTAQARVGGTPPTPPTLATNPV